MKHSEVNPTPNHSSTPRRSGRQPTSFSVAREIPLPMRNSVAVRPRRPRWKSPFERCACVGRYVLKTAARIKNAMNQGNWRRERLCLMAAVARASEFYGGADDQGLWAVFRGGADDGAGVVDRQRCPESELRLRKMEGVPDG